MKRLLDLVASDVDDRFGRKELVESIRAASGRTLCAEVVAPAAPLLGDTSNAELVSCLGGDLLLLNMFDVDSPTLRGMPRESDPDVVRELRRLTGKFVGLNLEPTEDNLSLSGERTAVPPGRRFSPENVKKAIDQGFQFLCLTGNPGVGISSAGLARACGEARRAAGDALMIVVGKMHAAGNAREAGSKILSVESALSWVDAGADVVMFPCPGTEPGVTPEAACRLAEAVHERGALAMTAIGTSQEGADEATIRQFGLTAKTLGADIQHIGDAGWHGVAVPENVLALSIAIRGRRHAYRRMARQGGR